MMAAFSRQGYSCEEVSPPRPGWRSFYCVRLDQGAGVPTQTVGFEGPGRQIAYIEAGAFGTSGQVAMAFLDSVINLTVNQQAQNTEAREWEHASIDQQDTETQIGGVHLAMLQSPDPYPAPCRRLIVTPS
jgi:hypothetical protein